MGLGKVNVFISELDHGCKVDSRTWYVTIYDCDGRVFEWCGRRYAVLPAPCGHLEVALPPGCYTLVAVWSFATTPGGVIYGNHFTDHGVVHVCCDQTACVTLFTPAAHRCGVLFDVALRVLQQRPDGGPPPELVRRAHDTIQELLTYLPRPAHPMELGHLDELMTVLDKGAPQNRRGDEEQRRAEGHA
jgi:hypothetical protein